MQMDKTMTILNNMDRGIVLWLDWSRSSLFREIPDVYAVRLCQTRIYSFINDFSPVNCLPESLKRLEPAQVFSAEKFCLLLENHVIDPVSQPCPSSTFALAFGQKVASRTDNLSTVLASCLVTVERARTALDSVLDGNAVCISDVTSGDNEARWLENIFVTSCQLNSFDWVSLVDCFVFISNYCVYLNLEQSFVHSSLRF